MGWEETKINPMLSISPTTKARKKERERMEIKNVGRSGDCSSS
jgi:hypothetical protein